MFVHNRNTPHTQTQPSIAQLVERWTVVDDDQESIGRWFKSGSKDVFTLKISNIIDTVNIQFYFISKSNYYRVVTRSSNQKISLSYLINILSFSMGSRGRVVKASDQKSDSLWERRFESYRLRKKSVFSPITY